MDSVQEGSRETRLALGLCFEAGADTLSLIDQVLHILGGWVSVGFAEEYSIEYCPRLQFLGGGVPDSDWDKFLLVQE